MNIFRYTTEFWKDKNDLDLSLKLNIFFSKRCFHFSKFSLSERLQHDLRNFFRRRKKIIFSGTSNMKEVILFSWNYLNWKIFLEIIILPETFHTFFSKLCFCFLKIIFTERSSETSIRYQAEEKIGITSFKTIC